MEFSADKKLLVCCLTEIETQLAWGPSRQWPNQNFQDLSEQLYEKTGVLLSPTTLKRVWGRLPYKSAPSRTTLNALSQFLGFDNWRSYSLSKTKGLPTPSQRKSKLPTQQNNNRGIVLTTAAFLTVLFISLFSMTRQSTTNIVRFGSEHFNSAPLAEGLPNSVVFNLDLQEVESDCLYIQQFWDPNKTIRLRPGQKQATGIYYWPGYFRSKLIVDGQVQVEHDLFIKSNGWMATLDYEPIPKYQLELNKTPLQLPEDISEEIKTSKTPLYSTYHYVEPFEGTDADNFVFETELKNIWSDKWAVCQTVKLVVLGSKGAMIVPFSIKGCASDLGLMLNDHYISGKEQDLSALTTHFKTFQKIKLVVENKAVTIHIGNQIVFKGSYQEPVGDLVGVRIKFLGVGAVGPTSIQSLSGGNVWDAGIKKKPLNKPQN